MAFYYARLLKDTSCYTDGLVVLIMVLTGSNKARSIKRNGPRSEHMDSAARVLTAIHSEFDSHETQNARAKLYYYCYLCCVAQGEPLGLSTMPYIASPSPQ